jgi:hypothetical protein
MTTTPTTLNQGRVRPQVGAVTTPTSDISNPSFVRAPERYWIVSYADPDLRFSLRPAAEKWAAAPEAKGVSVELSFHDHAAESPHSGDPAQSLVTDPHEAVTACLRDQSLPPDDNSC